MALYSQSCGFSSSHVRILELEPKEGWLPENWRLQIVRWEKFFRAPWTARRSNQSILKEICPEYSLERPAGAETPIFWSPDANNWLIGKDPDAGKDWGQEEKRTTEDEMVGWHHWLSGHASEQTPGDGERQESLTCCSARDCRVRHDSETEQQRVFGVPYISTYIWNLEGWYWWTYLQSSNGNADTENKLVDTGREGDGKTNWESSIETHFSEVKVKSLSRVQLLVTLWTVAP